MPIKNLSRQLWVVPQNCMITWLLSVIVGKKLWWTVETKAFEYPKTKFHSFDIHYLPYCCTSCVRTFSCPFSSKNFHETASLLKDSLYDFTHLSPPITLPCVATFVTATPSMKSICSHSPPNLLSGFQSPNWLWSRAEKGRRLSFLKEDAVTWESLMSPLSIPRGTSHTAKKRIHINLKSIFVR